MPNATRAGVYSGEFSQMYSGETKNGKEFVAIEYELTHYWTGAWEPVTDERPARIMLFTTPAAWEFTREKLELLGFNGNFEKPAISDQYKSQVQLENKPQDGYDRWDIMALQGIGGFGHSSTVAKKQQAQWNVQKPPQVPEASETPTAPKAEPKPPPAPSNTEGPEEELPF